MEAFMQKLTRELADESPATPFLMTGFSERIKIVHKMQYSGHIAMTRAVARIDLCTMLSNANDLLAITSITLKNGEVKWKTPIPRKPSRIPITVG